MADLSDVEAGLVNAIISAVYAEGENQPSVTGAAVIVYRGWPVTRGLQDDLGVGNVHVSVFAMPGATRNTTRWPVQLAASTVAPGLTVLVEGPAVYFGGVASAGQVAGVLVDGVPYVYRVQAGDSAALVASILGNAVRQSRPALVSGASLNIPGAFALVGRVVADALGTEEWARQEQAFRISVWAPDPRSRDVVSGAISRSLVRTPFLELQDGTAGRLRYRSTANLDDDQDARLYRRDLVYEVEYATTIGVSLPCMLFGDIGLNDAIIFG